MKTVDVIIVGQGIAGTFLSFELIDAGFSVMVIDHPMVSGASRVASGVINPVTGRRVVETWKIDELLPLASGSYQRISKKSALPSLAKSVEVLSVHGSQQMRDAFQKRQREGSPYIKNITADAFQNFFTLPYGGHVIYPALLIDLGRLLVSYREYLKTHGWLLESKVNWQSLQLDNDKLGQYGAVAYQYGPEPDQTIAAKWMIAADGAAGAENPYFQQLAFRYNKGEALIVSIPGLSSKYIYKLKYSIVPWGSYTGDGGNVTHANDRDDIAEHLFWVGSSYQWNFDNDHPSEGFKRNVLEFLESELLMPFKVVDHLAAIRPASINRRPFAGLHPDYPQLGILNGLGTKGCSLAPYLAIGWRDLLTKGKSFDPEVRLETARQ